MNCPNCGESINDVQHFCSNCGMNLDNKPLLFKKHKQAVKKEFLSHCKDIIGEHYGCSKLGQAAWFIATNTESNFAYLQGDEMGSAKSYDLLEDAVKDAYAILHTLYVYATEHRKGMPVPCFRYVRRNSCCE